MADPMALSRDGLIEETPLSMPDANTKIQNMEIVSPADVPRSKIKMAAILVALYVCCIHLVSFSTPSKIKKRRKKKKPW
jgi:hypothetical protein